ncbi:MAG: transposase [Bacteroides sp.]|nr:transposase [Bacteroides sp.]
MAQSLSKLYVHLIFHVRYPACTIHSSHIDRLYAYIGTVIRNNDCIPIQIGGMPDHIHVLCVLSKNLSMAKLVEEIKRNSSRWIKQIDSRYSGFAWQGGYGAFSVSPSVCDKTVAYIRNQDTHHQKSSFREEYLLFLQEYGITYDENYLWREERKK